MFVNIYVTNFDFFIRNDIVYNYFNVYKSIINIKDVLSAMKITKKTGRVHRTCTLPVRFRIDYGRTLLMNVPQLASVVRGRLGMYSAASQTVLPLATAAE